MTHLDSKTPAEFEEHAASLRRRRAQLEADRAAVIAQQKQLAVALHAAGLTNTRRLAEMTGLSRGIVAGLTRGQPAPPGARWTDADGQAESAPRP